MSTVINPRSSAVSKAANARAKRPVAYGANLAAPRNGQLVQNADKLTAMFSAKQIGITSFFGGPISAAIMVSANQAQSKGRFNPLYFLMAMSLAVLAQLVFLSIVVVIPDLSPMSMLWYTVVGAVGCSIAKQQFGPQYTVREYAEKKSLSVMYCVGIAIVGVVVNVAMGFVLLVGAGAMSLAS